MRWTVLSSDILVFFPAVLVFVALYYRQHANQEQAWALAMILLQPALMLIDHGHFQVLPLLSIQLIALHFITCSQSCPEFMSNC
jgi:hypothetical protein